MTFVIHLAVSQIHFLPNHFVLILFWLTFNALSLISVASSNSFRPLLFISPPCRAWCTPVTFPLTFLPYKDDRPSLFKVFIRSFSLFIFLLSSAPPFLLWALDNKEQTVLLFLVFNVHFTRSDHTAVNRDCLWSKVLLNSRFTICLGVIRTMHNIPSSER